MTSRSTPSRLPAAAQATFDTAALDDGQLVTLAHGETRALVAPHVGGSIAAFYDTAGHAPPFHWLRPATRAALDARDPLGMASFPLMPYCNRIRDGRFRFEGEMIDLPSGTGALRHALHGHAWRRPWTVEARTDSTLTLHFLHEPHAFTSSHGPDSHAGTGWPFRYEARQHLTLDASGLTVRLWARNLAARPMPFGLGHHPYYPRPSGTRIAARVRAMWEIDAEVLPVSLNAHPAVDALQAGLLVDDFDLDNNFSGWRHEAQIEWPHEGRRLALRASAPLDFFVLFSPPGLPYFCAEPVSNTTDWLNLRHAGTAQRIDVGGTVLAPGETLETQLAWLPERL
ncbi:aldose 1-epimerase [Paraburkholderia unamae]|uniref:Aldose 1-epimerase n=1 Tax=Paraburkholderia unamae TaxID=219649 RepID=A0ABX5K5Q4_9BURK|nr:aldose 1-epimerase [Paraburkholderia unamae]PVX59475.1 aldose 1-epimerase [Paraburkholderia unamae]RAR47664.1 aldose 1-epimerase [Paraburkholderia unamae]